MSVTASSLVVVSNRLPFTVIRQPDGSLQRLAAAGGLVTAVAPVVIQTSGLWVGWAGSQLAEDCSIPESEPSDSSPFRGGLESQGQDHLRRGRQHGRGRHDSTEGDGILIQGRQLQSDTDFG